MIAKPLRQLLKLLVPLSIAAVLTGCWDKVDLQDIGYVTAIGADYEDGKFKMYGEMVEFSAVAKSEGTSMPTGPQKWIGHGEGPTVLVALTNLIKSSQYQLSIENLKTLIIHERAMPMLDELLDAMNRQRAARYTVWLFGTRTPLDRLFATNSIFNQSPLVSFLYKPDLMYKQASVYRPLNMQLFIQQQNERSYTTALANITLAKGVWKAGQRPLSLNVPQGSFILNYRRLVGYMTEEELTGLRWVLPDFKREMLSFQSEGDRATVSVDQSISRLSGKPTGDSAHFKLRVRLRVHVVEVEGQMNRRQIETAVSEKVGQEIKYTYERALEKRADILQTRLNLYRYHMAYWKKHASKDEWLPGKDDLTIEVTTKMTDTGKYDLH